MIWIHLLSRQPFWRQLVTRQRSRCLISQHFDVFKWKEPKENDDDWCLSWLFFNFHSHLGHLPRRLRSLKSFFFKREWSSQPFYISLYFSEVIFLQIDSINWNRFNQFKFWFKYIHSIKNILFSSIEVIWLQINSISSNIDSNSFNHFFHHKFHNDDILRNDSISERILPQVLSLLFDLRKFLI